MVMMTMMMMMMTMTMTMMMIACSRAVKDMQGHLLKFLVSYYQGVLAHTWGGRWWERWRALGNISIWALGTDNFLGVEGPSISVSQGPGGVLNRYLTLHLIVNIIVNGDGALLSFLPWLGVDSM